MKVLELKNDSIVYIKKDCKDIIEASNFYHMIISYLKGITYVSIECLKENYARIRAKEDLFEVMILD